MARPSKVDRLPTDLRELIGTLRRQGCTIAEIFAKLQELEADVGRSGLGEYIRKFDAVASRIHQSRAAAEAIMARLDDVGSDDRVARFNVAGLHASIMHLMAGEDGEPVQLEPKDAKALAETLRNLASASKLDIERVEKIEQRASRKAKEQLLKAAEAAAASAEAKGEKLDGAAVLKKIREDIYGIYEE